MNYQYNESNWLTVRDVAELASCSEKTIRNYIKSGLLKAHRRGTRSIVIHLDDYSDFYKPYRTQPLRRFN